MNGESSFKVTIDRLAIAQIADKYRSLMSAKEVAQFPNADDLTVYGILKAFKEFLEERRCEPDFIVVINEPNK